MNEWVDGGEVKWRERRRLEGSWNRLEGGG